jgi:hypothetical protein
MDLKGIVKEGANWAILNAVMNLRIKKSDCWLLKDFPPWKWLVSVAWTGVDKCYSLMTMFGVSNVFLARKEFFAIFL